MLRVKALVFEHDKTRCVCGYAYDFYLEDEDAIIMQSTRLVDKEGTEVFEGDILRHQIQTEYTFIVKYDKDKGRWYGDGLSRTVQIDITTDFLKFYKVIGNAYENPGEETTTAVYSYNNGEYELFRSLENKFTGERAEVK